MPSIPTYPLLGLIVLLPICLTFDQQDEHEFNRSVSVTSEQLVGTWHVEPQLTHASNRQARKGMSPETISKLDSMKMKLNADGRFQQSMGADYEIIGTWKFSSEESKSSKPELLPSGVLTLIPENLENHANMEYQIVFAQLNLIQATPPLGTGTVFLRKPKEERAAPVQAKKTKGQERDRAAEVFAKVPGCLGARSLEHDGVQMSFVWFKDRKAVVDWCKSAKHMATAQKMMEMADPKLKMREPLEAAPKENGPFLVIMTLKTKKNMDGSFPLEQLSMELYKPVKGGMFIGERFAPQPFKVQGMREIKTN